MVVAVVVVVGNNADSGDGTDMLRPVTPGVTEFRTEKSRSLF